LSSINHFSAIQGNIGAGSSVTNQYGFFCASNTGATNNFGFYGNIASGTGRWNFYANGTADNYFAGNVGIGTSSPSAPLEITRDGDTVLLVKATNTGGGTDNEAILRLDSAPGGESQIEFQVDAVNVVRIECFETGNRFGIFAIKPEMAMTFGTNNTERMRIDSAGNVGIGTNTPAANLQIGNGSSATLGSTAPRAWISARAKSSSNVPTTPQELLKLSWQESSQDLGSGEGCAINFAASLDVDSGTFYDVAQISSFKENTSDAVGTGRLSALIFSTSGDGIAAPIERLRITSGGSTVATGDIRTTTVVSQATSPVNLNSSSTLSVSSLLGGIRTGTPTANINYTLPTGTNLDAGFQDLQTNQTIEWSVINLAAATHVITVVANTAHTVVGNMAVAANSSARFMTRKTGSNTFVTYRGA
jgi:hypothetical protein